MQKEAPPTENLHKLIPRVSLRTIFLVFLCVAIGLAMIPSLGAIEPAFAVLISIGLVQQVYQLTRWRQAPANLPAHIVFARWYAIAWRLALIATITIWMVIEKLESEQILQLSDHDDIWFYLQSGSILQLCVVVVLCNSVCRWKSDMPHRSPGKWWVATFWFIAIVVGGILLLDQTIIQFLVHKAVAGLEAAFPLAFRRPGLYPDLSIESYRTQYLGLAAVVSLLVATGLLLRRAKRPDGRRTAKFYALSFLLLVPPVAFSYWYYQIEFYRLSPELAGAGYTAIWMDWLIGAALGIALAATIAYRLCRDEQVEAVVTDDLSRDVEHTAIYESFFSIVVIGLFYLYLLAMDIAATGSAHGMLARTPPVWAHLTWYINPWSLLNLAQVIAVVQLFLLRWRHRSQKVAWKISGVFPVAFVRDWAALALLILVAVPTLNAYAFVLWLGPFDLIPIFGY